MERSNPSPEEGPAQAGRGRQGEAGTAQARIDPSRLATAGLRAFFRIARRWQLSNREARCLLGMPSHWIYLRWCWGMPAAVSRDVLDRISLIMGIYQALHVLFSDPVQADGWVRRPNSAPGFEGRSALECMLTGGVIDLLGVRSYLQVHIAGANAKHPPAVPALRQTLPACISRSTGC